MLEKFARYPLTFGPTPIEKLARLSAHLGGGVEIFAKRDDCNSGLAFGGNKIRKLEYIVPDAIASGADTLVTIGGVQSNHTRQVAATAAKLGMKCRLVQESWVPFEDAVYDRVGNILMSRVMGAEIELVDEGFDIGIRESWERAIADVKARGGKPYAIPAGASVHPLGGLGYVGFAEEVRAQEKRARLQLRLHRRLHRHRLDACRHGRRLRQGRPAAQRDRHRRLRSRPSRPGRRFSTSPARPPSSSGSAATIADDDVVLNEDYAYPVYGVPSAETNDGDPACRTARRHDDRPGL